MKCGAACLATALLLSGGGVTAKDADDQPLPFIRTSFDDSHFYDEYGRVRIFHGNARVDKGFPWVFPHLVDTDEELDRFEELGFNVVRLGWMWSGFNPEPDYFNQTYAERIMTVVDGLAERGIYTLLDMHQDVLSSKFCLYDGVPLWVVNKSTPKHAFPWPLTGNCSSRSWARNSATEAAVHAYQDLYDNHEGMLDDMATFWKRSAELFLHKSSVIGYELINEPFAGDFYEDPAIMMPGVAGSKNLAPMYEKLASSIREIDDRHIIFFEPVTWGMIFDGPAYQNRSAYTFHYYCDTFAQGYVDHPEEAKLICDDVAAPAVFAAVKEDLEKFGGATFMSEGLACPDKAMEECRAVERMLDDHFISYTDYGNSQDEVWNPTDLQEKTWARVYARAIAGQPTNMTFSESAATKDFELCFTPDTSIAEPTEIFLGTKFNYKHGAAVTCGTDLVCTPAEIPPPSESPRRGLDDVLLVKPSSTSVSGEEQCVRIKGHLLEQ